MFFAAVIIGGLALSSICFGYYGGSGTPEEPYQIANKEDLLALAADTSNYDKCFILTADINMGGDVFTTAIIASVDAFTGTFDGNGLKITNFTINGGSGDYLGLFGYISSGGAVKNLGLENCTVSGSSDSHYIGGLVGYNYYYSSISNCYSTGSVSGYYGVGGLVGYNVYSANISNCYSTGVVSGTSGSYYIGGLVGYNYYSSISNCYSTGAVSGTSDVGGLVGYTLGSISDCYSTGTVSGTSDVGGLVGANSGSISGCYFLDTSGLDNDYGEPLTDERMKQQASFTGWDFMTIWAICEGTNYPRLRWQIPAADWICPDGVNVEDLDYFVQRWLLGDCASSNNCDGADMNGSGTVDFADFAIFAQHWLEGL
jgi:hypothetical protein